MYIRFCLKENDPVVEQVYNSTEEGKKVTRNEGSKYFAMFERIEDPFTNRTGNKYINGS